jgi:D-alanine transaminase
LIVTIDQVGLKMSRTVYLNGNYVAEEDAKVSVFDRGFLFADGVYEVTTVLNGKLISFDAHLARLHRSLGELDMNEACSDDELLNIHRKLVEVNNVKEGLVYLQVTRGVAERDFFYPASDTAPSLFLFTQDKSLIDSPLSIRGANVITVEDQRWSRRDIKSIQLLSQSMAKMEAKRANADDAWFVTDGLVNEATSSNTYIITHDNIIVTRHLSNQILHGITREAILKVAKDLDLHVEERPFTIDEAINAKEAFMTGSASLVCPVVSINGSKIGTGKPEKIVNSIRETYIALAKKHSI